MRYYPFIIYLYFYDYYCHILFNINISFYNDYLGNTDNFSMEANLVLIEFFCFCLIIKIIDTYKNSNDVKLTK